MANETELKAEFNKAAYYFNLNDSLCIDGDVRLVDLIEKKLDASIETPFFLYNKSKIISNFKNYLQSFNKLLNNANNIESFISYSVKANFNPYILKLLLKHSSFCSLVNGNELNLALKCGFDGSRLIFNGNGKTRNEIKNAIMHSCYLNIDSEFNLIDTLNASKKLFKQNLINEPVKIILRINPSIDAKVHQYLNTSIKTSKFGVNLNDLDRLIEIIKENNEYLKLVGYHCHLGSTITSTDVYEKCIDCLLDLVNISHSQYKISTIDTINIGGGLGIDYKRYAKRTLKQAQDVQSLSLPTPFDLASVVAERLKNYEKKLKVIVEPGRSLIANTCLLVTKLLGVKCNENRNFLVVDASMCEVIRPCLYSAYHHIDYIESVKEVVDKLDFDIVGPVCESGDFLGKERYLVKPKLYNSKVTVDEQDNKPVYLAVFDVGAYCGAMASNYNMRLRPAEIVIDNYDDELKQELHDIEKIELQVIRRADTFDDLLKPFNL